MNIFNWPDTARSRASPLEASMALESLSSRADLTLIGQVQDWQLGWAGRIQCTLRLPHGKLTLHANRGTLPLEIRDGSWVRVELIHRPDDGPGMRVLNAVEIPPASKSAPGDIVKASNGRVRKKPGDRARDAHLDGREPQPTATAREAGDTLTMGFQHGAAPILFLDLDDVLCLNSPYGGFDAIAAVNDRHINPARVYQGLFESHAVGALQQIHDQLGGKLRYVISSTWRDSFSRAQLEVVFRRAGLGFVADRLQVGEMWRTPPKFGRSRRVDEIAEWLDRHHQGEPFAIVDDTYSGASLMPALLPALLPALMSAPLPRSNVPAMKRSTNLAPHPFVGRVTLCEENVGLSGGHVPSIVAALRRPVPMASLPA